MRKVVLSVYVTLDGVMEHPAWTAPFWSDELAKVAHSQLFASDALLLGRKTYEGFVQAWPTMTDADGFADRMNALPKFVASTTLQTAEWNATILQGDIAAEVAALKNQPGQDLLIYGSGDFVQTLLRHNLIDEYRLWVHPVILGKGKRLFQENTEATLKLTDTKVFSSGVVLLYYVPSESLP